MDQYTRYPLMSDVLRMMGIRIVGEGMFASPMNRQTASFDMGCVPNVVVNGIPNQPINDVNPRNVGAIAIGGSGSMYDTYCGLIEIWTKR